jgi:hypothetical protein
MQEITFDNLWDNFDQFLENISKLKNQDYFKIFTNKLSLFGHVSDLTVQIILEIELYDAFASDSQFQECFTGYDREDIDLILREWLLLNRSKSYAWIGQKLLGQTYGENTWI